MTNPVFILYVSQGHVLTLILNRIVTRALALTLVLALTRTFTQACVSRVNHRHFPFVNSQPFKRGISYEGFPENGRGSDSKRKRNFIPFLLRMWS